MRILGMISGTSHDGIDVAIVDFMESEDGLTGRIEYTDSVPYSRQLRAELIAALPPAGVGFDVACHLDTRIGQAFAEAARSALASHAALPDAGPVDAICSHGQTVFHWVDRTTALGTLQLGQPAWIAESTGLPVISNVRAADIAAGGQGAPLVPILDLALLAPAVSEQRRAGALNLGGISNITVCAPGEDPAAWDIGPSNALIDAVVTASDEVAGTYDQDGRLAAAGTVSAELLAVLLAEPYYALPAPKSSGKELFHGEYVRDAVARARVQLSLADLVATLTELTARTVAAAIVAARLELVVAAGGGVRNPVLMGRLRALLPGVRVTTCDELGIPSDEKEATAFALIGWATLHGLPGNVPSCTGASGPRVLGCITPGPDGAVPSARRLAAWPGSVGFAPTGSGAQ